MVGGVSWQVKPSDVDVIREMVEEMSERRLLAAHLDAENEAFVNASVLELRGRLTEALKKLTKSTPLYESVARMRVACNDYLTEASDPISAPFTHLRPHFRDALLKLRSVAQDELTLLGTKLKLDSAQQLAARIPDEVFALPQIAPGPETRRYVEEPADLPWKSGPPD
jgi:hypothetical protein